MSLTNSEPAPTAGILGATQRVDRAEADVGLKVRAHLLNAWLEARALNGEAEMTAKTVGKLDVMFRHITSSTAPDQVQ